MNHYPQQYTVDWTFLVILNSVVFEQKRNGDRLKILETNVSDIIIITGTKDAHIDRKWNDMFGIDGKYKVDAYRWLEQSTVTKHSIEAKMWWCGRSLRYREAFLLSYVWINGKPLNDTQSTDKNQKLFRLHKVLLSLISHTINNFTQCTAPLWDWLMLNAYASLRFKAEGTKYIETMIRILLSW